MTAHPLMETHFEHWPEDYQHPDTIVRHLYHIPRIGDRVVVSESGVTIQGRVIDVTWTGELVIVRVGND